MKLLKKITPHKTFMIKKSLLILLCIISSYEGYSQKHISGSENELLYKRGLELLDKEKFSAARHAFESYVKENPEGIKSSEARYYVAFSALQLNNQDGEKLIETFIEANPTHPKSLTAYYELGEYYFKDKNYSKAITYLEKVNVQHVSSNQRTETYFMLGYSHFTRQNFDKSLNAFNQIKKTGNRYSAAANYYSGYIYMRNGEYDKALVDLQEAEKSEAYAAVVPMMIVNAYYKQKRYTDLISYAENMISKKGVKVEDDLYLLIADSYYKTNNFDRAAKYYEQYAEKKKNIVDTDVLFRIGFTNYSIGERSKAINNFKNVALKDDTLSQIASYYLGGLYFQENNKMFALTAFDKARKQKFNPSIQEQALFNFAKLNIELAKNNDAISALTEFTTLYPRSENYNEATELLSEAFLNSNDYNQAIKHIESLQSRSNKIKRTYQKVTFYKGTEFFNNGQYFNAVQLFEKSLENPLDDEFVMLANFWMGEAYSIGRKYDEAINAYSAIFRVRGSERTQHHLKTRYSIGYAYYNTQQYDKALIHFKEYVNKLEKADNKLFYNDAVLRLADCYYVNKGYNSALTYYEKALNENNPDKDYALFQKGMILGILGKVEEAKSQFDIIITQYPKSRHVDESIFYKANLDFEKGNYAAAIAGFTNLINTKKTSTYIAQAFLNRGISNFNLKNYDQTIRDYKIILTEFTSSIFANGALLGLQEVLSLQNRTEEFDEYLVKYKQANPESKATESIEFEAAKSLYFNEKYSRAISGFQDFMKAYPTSSYLPEAKFYIAESYFRSNDINKALPYYYEIVKDNKSNNVVRSVQRIAELEFQNKRYRESISFYHRLSGYSRTKKEQYNAWSGLMESYYMISKFDSVNYFANTILERGIVSANAQNKAQLYLGKSAYAQGNYDKAVDEFINTLNTAKDENGAEAQYLMADIFYKRKQYKQSIEYLHNLNSTFALFEYWFGRSFLLIADNYIALDEVFQAKATLNSVIEKSPVKAIVEEAKQKLNQINEREKNKTGSSANQEEKSSGAQR
jgi:TolA-binding protein